ASNADVAVRAARLDEAGTVAVHRRGGVCGGLGLSPPPHPAPPAAPPPPGGGGAGRGGPLWWVVVAAACGGRGGGGGWVMDWPPHTLHLEPRGGYILNVYVAPDFRRRGLARMLTLAALDWCRANGIGYVALHASEAGRPVYDGLGFKPTNEMSLPL